MRPLSLRRRTVRASKVSTSEPSAPSTTQRSRLSASSRWISPPQSSIAANARRCGRDSRAAAAPLGARGRLSRWACGRLCAAGALAPAQPSPSVSGTVSAAPRRASWSLAASSSVSRVRLAWALSAARRSPASGCAHPSPRSAEKRRAAWVIARRQRSGLRAFRVVDSPAARCFTFVLTSGSRSVSLLSANVLTRFSRAAQADQVAVGR